MDDYGQGSYEAAEHGVSGRLRNGWGRQPPASGVVPIVQFISAKLHMPRISATAAAAADHPVTTHFEA